MAEVTAPIEEEAPTALERSDEYPFTKHAATVLFVVVAISFSILFMRDLLLGSGTGG